jgi:hypothetical protein
MESFHGYMPGITFFLGQERSQALLNVDDFSYRTELMNKQVPAIKWLKRNDSRM